MSPMLLVVVVGGEDETRLVGYIDGDKDNDEEDNNNNKDRET